MTMNDTKKKKRPIKKRHSSSSKNRTKFRIIGLLVVCMLAIVFAVLAWNHYQTLQAQTANRLDAIPSGSDGTFTQASPDVPLYVLIVGIDNKDTKQANFIGVAAVNKDKKHIDFIMLPDNTKIEGRKQKGAQELQDVYAEGGLSLTRAVVEDIFHIPIPYYAAFTSDSFTKMIDMSGGLPMYVEKNMYHADDNGITDINLFQGYQKLDGAEALGYMRAIDSDGYLSRTQRQERFVKVFYTDREQHFGITNMLFMYRFWNNVDSNIAAKEMAKLAFAFRSVPADDISFYILPGELSRSSAEGNDNSSDYWTFDPVEVQKIIGTTNNAISTPPDPETKDKDK
jgi:LCP family protein required for cell wall assembly